MDKYLIEQSLVGKCDIKETEREVFDNFSNTNLPFRFGTKWIYTCKDKTKQKLISKEMVYGDDSFRKFVKKIFYNQEREILTENEYLTFNDKKDSKYKDIDFGCFDDFFGIIIYTENNVNGVFNSDTKLVCYTYDGQLIGNFEPLSNRFENYTNKDIESLIDMVKQEVAKKEEKQL